MKNNVIFVGKMLLGTLSAVFLLLAIISMTGFSINKNYFTFDQAQCIAEKYNDGTGDDIESCVYWMRISELEETEQWRKSFSRDDMYCDARVSRHTTQSGRFTFVPYNPDPRCEYNAYKDALIEKNINYLTSQERDSIFQFCALERCPAQPLIN